MHFWNRTHPYVGDLLYTVSFPRMPRKKHIPHMKRAKGKKRCPTVQTTSLGKMNWKNLRKWELENAFLLFSQTPGLNSNSRSMTVSVSSGMVRVDERRMPQSLDSIQKALPWKLLINCDSYFKKEARVWKAKLSTVHLYDGYPEIKAVTCGMNGGGWGGYTKMLHEYVLSPRHNVYL